MRTAVGHQYCTASKGSFKCAGVAQLVEQLTCNEKVEGSIPFTGTNKYAGHSDVARFNFWAGVTLG